MTQKHIPTGKEGKKYIYIYFIIDFIDLFNKTSFPKHGRKEVGKNGKKGGFFPKPRERSGKEVGKEVFCSFSKNFLRLSDPAPAYRWAALGFLDCVHDPSAVFEVTNDLFPLARCDASDFSQQFAPA
jgi:hypothetical protein